MQFARRLALCLAGAAFAGVMLSKALLPPRVSIEILIRARLLLSIAIALVGAWAMVSALKATQKTKRVAVIVLIMLVLAALPAAIVRTVWLADFGGRAETEVPPDDLRVLAHLREKSEPSAIVWQYPEPPHPANPSGEDAWVPIFAGRTVLNSLRATDYSTTAPYIALSERYFAGEDVPVPAQANWVYLSRSLHPETYESLLTDLSNNPAWMRRACYRDACAFERADLAATQ